MPELSENNGMMKKIGFYESRIQVKQRIFHTKAQSHEELYVKKIMFCLSVSVSVIFA